MKKLLLLLMMAFCLNACGRDLLGLVYSRSGDVETRFAQSMEYNAQTGYSSIRVPDDNYRVYVITDSHVMQKETRNLDRFVKERLLDPTAAPFWINLGDNVKGKGQAGVFENHIAPLVEAGIRHFPSVGNHDLYFGEWEEWRSRFHTSTYWFEVVTPGRGKDLFLCLDTAGGTLGRSQRAWVEDFLAGSKGKYDHVTVFTHTHFWKRDNSQFPTSNYTLEETYDLVDLFARMGVEIVLSGHDHATETTLFKGVRYETLESLKMEEISPGYNIFTYGKDIKRTYVPVE